MEYCNEVAAGTLVFPEDVVVEISTHLDLVSAVKFLSASKRFWNIRNRTQVKNIDILSPLANEQRWNWGLGSAAFLNDKIFIEYFIQQGAKRWDLGLRGACSGGHKELVEFFIHKGAMLGDKFHFTIGHFEVENYLMQHGACDWQIALASAAASGNKARVQLCVEKGADDWNRALYSAALSGNKDLVDYFISQGATDWNQGLAGAACAGNLELIHFFIKKGADDWNRAMMYAIPVYALAGICGRPSAPQENLIEFFIQKGASDWKYAISECIEYEHRGLAEFFVKKGATWDQCISSAHKRGYREMEEYFIARKKEYLDAKNSNIASWQVFGKWSRSLKDRFKPKFAARRRFQSTRSA